MPERAPKGWARTQKSIADSSGISLALVEGNQLSPLAIANNNSICEGLLSSPEHVKLCEPYCGLAHSMATGAKTITHYRCHAGLQCFAMPVKIEGERELVVIGGRAFVSGSDYREFVERVRFGDLRESFSEELFRNVIFAEEADLDQAALRVARAAEDLDEKAATDVFERPAAQAREAARAHQRGLAEAEDLRKGIGLRQGFNHRRPFAD